MFIVSQGRPHRKPIITVRPVVETGGRKRFNLRGGGHAVRQALPIPAADTGRSHAERSADLDGDGETTQHRPACDSSQAGITDPADPEAYNNGTLHGRSTSGKHAKERITRSLLSMTSTGHTGASIQVLLTTIHGRKSHRRLKSHWRAPHARLPAQSMRPGPASFGRYCQSGISDDIRRPANWVRLAIMDQHPPPTSDGKRDPTGTELYAIWRPDTGIAPNRRIWRRLPTWTA